MKNRIFKTTALAATVMLALTACNMKTTEKSSVIEAKPKGTTSAETSVTEGTKTQIIVIDSMSASELADAGEQLVSPYTFMLADKAFTAALEKDPKNFKALFYKELLKRMMVFKGSLKRAKPLYAKDGRILEYNKIVQQLPNSPLKDFLLNSDQPNFTNLNDLQTLLVNYNEAILSFRNFLAQNPEGEMIINLNPYVFEEGIRQNAVDSCGLVNTTEGGFTIECDTHAAAQVKINSADLVLLRQMAGGEFLMWSLYTSFSVEGIEQLINAEKTQKLSPQQKLEIINETPSLGKLRADNQISKLETILRDIGAATKWAIKYQSQLCPTDSSETQASFRKSNKRKGHLFKEGICITDGPELQKSLDLYERALAGAIKVPVNEGTPEATSVEVNFMAWVKNPPKSLQDMTPTAFNSCGEAIAYKDLTFGGLYPAGFTPYVTPGCAAK